MKKDICLTPAFDSWAGRQDVQEQARAFIATTVAESEELLAKLETPVIGLRLMNFGVIGHMNGLFWHCEKQLHLDGVAGRGDFNHLAMQPDPQWRKVIPLFAYALGFRFQAPTGPIRA
jgi:hypothetical protein